MNKRVLVAVAAAGIIGGGTYGFAATLGVTSDGLGAGSAGVASCDADSIHADYTATYVAASGEYRVTAVELSDIAAACAGQQLQITLSGTDLAVEETVTVAAVDGVQSVTFAPDVSAAAVTGVDVVVSPA